MWFNAPHTQVNRPSSAPPGKIIVQPMASKVRKQVSRVAVRNQGDKDKKKQGENCVGITTKKNGKEGPALPLILGQGQPSKARPRAVHGGHGSDSGTSPRAATGG